MSETWKAEDRWPEPVPGPESVTLKYPICGTVSGDNAKVTLDAERPVQPESDRNL